MREIFFDGFTDNLLNDNSEILFITSTNYEKRSLEWLNTTNQIIQQKNKSNSLNVVLITLENSISSFVLLDELTKFHSKQSEDYIKKFKEKISREEELLVNLNLESVSIDLGNSKKDRNLINSLEKYSKVKNIKIIFDITALPRRTILLVLEELINKFVVKNISDFFIVYSWPEKYPRRGRSTNTGILWVVTTDEDFDEFLKNSTNLYGITSIGRDGSINRLFLESVPNAGKVDTFFHAIHDDYLLALENFYENRSTVDFISNNISTHSLNYFLTISSGYDLFMEKTKNIINVWNKQNRKNENNRLLIAPFGPKPMVVSAFLCNKYANHCFNSNGASSKSGIIHVSSMQQSDLYSIGIKKTSCYQLDLNILKEIN